MGSKLGFSSIFLFFLTWGLQGFSLETQQMDGKTVLDQGVASMLNQVKQQSDEATVNAAVQGGVSIDAMPCMKKLMPCHPFMHSPSPPTTCCTPLKDMITEKGQCFCKVFNNLEFLKTVNLTMDEALALSKACGINVDTSVCKNATSSTTSPTTQPTSSKPVDIAIEVDKSKFGSLSNNSSDSSNPSSSKSNASVKITGVDGVIWSITSFATIIFLALYK